MADGIKHSHVSFCIQNNLQNGLQPYSRIDLTLQYLIKHDNRNFIIYPFGEIGILTKQILNQRYGITEQYIIDNSLSELNENIHNIDFLRSINLKDSLILLTTTLCESEILDTLRKVEIPDDKVIMIFDSKHTMEYYQKFQPFPVGKMSWGDLTISQNKYIKSIGSFCSIAQGVDIVSNHLLSCVSTASFLYAEKKLGLDSTVALLDQTKIEIADINSKATIKNDVWIGKNVIIENGITIGNGAIIGSSAVVTKDIPDYAIAVGVPAHVIKYRFRPSQIEELNKIQWWNWELKKITDCYEDFFNIELFLKKHGGKIQNV